MERHQPVQNRLWLRRTQELPVAVYFGLRKKTDLRVYRAPTVESGKNVTFFEQLFCFYQLVLVV